MYRVTQFNSTRLTIESWDVTNWRSFFSSFYGLLLCVCVFACVRQRVNAFLFTILFFFTHPSWSTVACLSSHTFPLIISDMFNIFAHLNNCEACQCASKYQKKHGKNREKNLQKKKTYVRLFTFQRKHQARKITNNVIHTQQAQLKRKRQKPKSSEVNWPHIFISIWFRSFCWRFSFHDLCKLVWNVFVLISINCCRNSNIFRLHFNMMPFDEINRFRLYFRSIPLSALRNFFIGQKQKWNPSENDHFRKRQMKCGRRKKKNVFKITTKINKVSANSNRIINRFSAETNTKHDEISSKWK